MSFESVEEVCESKSITLVIHPAIRRAVRGYEESFYIGLRCFLKGSPTGSFSCRSTMVAMSVLPSPS
ncbi:hypothetical protein, partial [Klebsiella oxytoca]|uniref:hypothetical protein n=1 Tax=Klebsiella oxytoca TaxID=571 RepID=UPI001B2FFB1D